MPDSRLTGPLVGVAAEPGLNVGASRRDPRAALAGVPQRGSHQRVAHPLAPARRGDLGVLQVQYTLRELAVEELGLAHGQIHDEAGAFGIVANGDCFGVTLG